MGETAADHNNTCGRFSLVVSLLGSPLLLKHSLLNRCLRLAQLFRRRKLPLNVDGRPGTAEGRGPSVTWHYHNLRGQGMGWLGGLREVIDGLVQI